MLTYEYTMELDFGDVPENIRKESEEKKISEGSQEEKRAEPVPTIPNAGAREHAFTLRCLPQESAVQHVASCHIVLEPDVPLSYGTDAFGTRYCWGIVHKLHTVFRVSVGGKAERYPERVEKTTRKEEELYRQRTAATGDGKALQELAAALHDAGQSNRERALAIRDLVYSTMTYTPGATAPFTMAEEAAENGRGVCQDYAHIMLAICRMKGIPARYTAGLLLGEGTSHAWVEIADGGRWIPMDPTNPDITWDEQLIFSHGRDARDCEINRGVYLGPGTQVQKIAAELKKR